MPTVGFAMKNKDGLTFWQHVSNASGEDNESLKRAEKLANDPGNQHAKHGPWIATGNSCKLS